jgi:hypothetical protein
MGSPRAASHITADRPTLFAGRLVLPELSGSALGAEHLTTLTSRDARPGAPVWPFRVFSLVGRTTTLPPLPVLLSDWHLVQSLPPAAPTPVLVKRSHFVVGLSLDLAVFPQQTPPETIIDSNGYSLRVRPPSRATPATPSWPAETGPTPLLGSASLQHIKERRSTCRGLCLPATFRPQGLVTLSAASSLRTRAGFVSRRQRSWDSPFGAFPPRKASTRFPTRIDPHAVSPRGDALTRSQSQSAWPQLLGLDPSESPLQHDTCLAHLLPDAPLGFPLSGHSGEDLAVGFRPSSSHVLGSAGDMLRQAGTSESRSASTWSRPPSTKGNPRLGQPS